MRIILSTLIILTVTLTGCFGVYSFKPVSSMSDSQLQNEYLDIEYKIRFKETEYFNTPSRVSAPPPTIKSYNTTGSANTYGNTYSNTYSNSSTYSGTTYMNTRTTANYDRSASRDADYANIGLAGKRLRLKADINALRNRLSALRLEMSRRGLYTYP